MRRIAREVFDGNWRFSGFFMGVAVKLRFGDLTFDGGTRQLWRGATEVHLSPKAFDLLQVSSDTVRARSRNTTSTSICGRRRMSRRQTSPA